MKNSYKKILSLSALAGLSLIISMQTAQASQSSKTGYMHPLGSISNSAINEVGTIFDKTYGAMHAMNGFILRAEQNKNPVHAARNGEIMYIGEDDYKGIHIDVLHPDMTRTTYGFLSSTDLAKYGSSVNKGDIIGYTNNDKLYYSMTDPKGSVIRPTLFTGQKNKQNYVATQKDLAQFSYWVRPGGDDPVDFPIDLPLEPGYSGPDYVIPPGFFEPDKTPEDTDSQDRVGTIKTGSSSSSDTSSSSGSSSGYGTSSAGSGSSATYGSAVSYSPFSDLTGSEAIDAITADATPLCPTSVAAVVQVAAVEEKLANQDSIKKDIFTEPVSINELSCFDNFATTMSSVVADIGISGAFDIGGSVGAFIDGAVASGIDGMASSGCDKANQLFNNVKNASYDVNALFQEVENPEDLLINSGIIENIIPKP